MYPCEQCINYINGECKFGNDGCQTDLYECYEPVEGIEEGR